MRRTHILAVLVSILSVSACARQEPAINTGPTSAALPSVASVNQLMLGIVIPASDIIFATASESPADDAAWIKVQANAAVIAEAAILMQSDGRRIDREQWQQFSKAMYDAGVTASAAAAEKNIEKMGAAGDALYESCDSCHQRYMPARQGETSASTTG
jgi:hypothetical protein